MLLLWPGVEQRRQHPDLGKQLLDLAVNEQVTGRFGPRDPLWSRSTKDGMSDIPDMLLGMVEVHNLHGPRKLLISWRSPMRTGLCLVLLVFFLSLIYLTLVICSFELISPNIVIIFLVRYPTNF